MDESIAAVEESYTRSDSQASASKSLGSLVQINSVAIDISCAMEEIELPAHDHFSMRGYVAGMREKDWKICLPFASEGDADDLVDNLPPLSVPRFRWWQCSNCIPDIAAERTTVEMLLLTDRIDASTSSCQNICGEKDGLPPYSKQNIGDDHVSRDSCRNEEDNGQNNKIIKYNPRCTEAHKGTTCSKDKTYVRNNEDGNTCAYITQTKPFQIRERHNDDADSPDMVCIVENPSIRVDEPENASLGRDGAFALPHRRKPKLRSLADIMEEVKNLNSEHPRMRSALSSGMQVTSTEIEADLDPQLQLDVPADITKSTISPQRKRKTGLVEDKEPLELTYPFGTAKRSKGPITDAEKTFRRVAISGIESEDDVSTRMDMRLSAKTQQIKPKKSKALDISRKMRRTHIDNRTIPMREVPKINDVHSTNSNKHAVATETNFSNKGHVSSPIGGMTQFIINSLSGPQRDRISEMSKRTEVEADHSPLMPSSKNVVGDRNVNGKVALDLSLNSCMGAERSSSNQASLQQHRGIPDLNVSFTEKTSMTQGKQLPYLSDNRSSTLQKNLDISASCSKELAREGKRQLGVSEQQPIQNMDNNVKHGGASDDIPMEIVELLAKNQRERALANSRTMTDFILNSIRSTPGVYMDGGPCMTNFPFTNTSGVSVASGKSGVTQGIVNFPQVKNGQINRGNLDESQFRLFSSSRPSQQTKAHYSAANSIVSRSRPSEGADPLWPPRRKNVPFHPSASDNHSIQPHSLGMHSFSDQCYKGKNIGDIKGCENKAVRNASAVKQGRIGPGPISVGSLDAYSNDAIPAMQLLSLMDRGIVPGSSVKVGSNSFHDKPFSPCSHHPRLNGNESQNDPFLSSSFFSQSRHTKKDFPLLLNGVCFSGSRLRKSYLQGQMPPQLGNSKANHLEGPSTLVIQHSRGHVALDVCTLNRNPADFSIPDAINEYTISAKDLKPRRRRNSSKKERSRPANVEIQKRLRMRKDAPAKVCSRK